MHTHPLQFVFPPNSPFHNVRSLDQWASVESAVASDIAKAATAAARPVYVVLYLSLNFVLSTYVMLWITDKCASLIIHRTPPTYLPTKISQECLQKRVQSDLLTLMFAGGSSKVRSIYLSPLLSGDRWRTYKIISICTKHYTRDNKSITKRGGLRSRWHCTYLNERFHSALGYIEQRWASAQISSLVHRSRCIY